MDSHISLQQVQKTILSPAMRQSIEVLMLPLQDLNLSIEQELQDNPLLEMSEPVTPPSNEDSLSHSLRDIDQVLKTRYDFSYQNHAGDDEDRNERPIRQEVSLEKKLIQQLRVELSGAEGIKIGEYIISNLDEDGYLKVTCEEVAESLRISDVYKVEYILRIIQDFDPLGIASRTLKECLRVQVDHSKYPDKRRVAEMIDNHLDDLGRKRYAEIARKMKMPLEEVKSAAAFIGTLEPKPARNYRPVYAHIYINPDICIVKDQNNDYAVQINKEGLPSLRINPYYRNLLTRKDLSPKDREFINEKLKNAILFMKSVEQRGTTLQNISAYILQRQKDFFKHGYSHLVPMTLKDVAQAVDRNESTISRAINNKYMDTPQGVLSMKFFFAQGIPESGQSDVASTSLKEEIRGLIEDENKTSPLSDEDIKKHFEERSTRIARRTIAKYRQALKILPSNLRKI